ncbi:LON peptidase substrate-binding domain-containing protein [Accumulibacter sp.]|uniref:LON peptidase substrate-binding domain-containing protein n=1 Tax=Accumulibacter sp. TaxID=2053492 RepID=UPI0025B80727|nr:LON peptidase substrate-binding domain-containing protein [Accumulibacter sp.]
MSGNEPPDQSEPFVASKPVRLAIPLFPLGAVLCPGGLLPLKVFEQRYLDMVAACLKEQSAFGVCLIASGGEVGVPAAPQPVGTLAHIVEVDMPQLGIMLLKVRGGRRFRIERHLPITASLQRATVLLLDEPPAQPVPPGHQGLVLLLRKIADELGEQRLPAPHAFDDASWVGYRLTEILPLQILARQKLLALQDPLLRLRALSIWLAQRVANSEP